MGRMIQWLWKFRIKRNTNRILISEGYIKDIKGRLSELGEKHNKSLVHISDQIKKLEVEIEDLEEKFNRTQVSFENLILRKSGREKHLGNKITALEEKVNILEENNEILESNNVNMVNKIEDLISIFKEFCRKYNLPTWLKKLESEEDG